MVSNEGVGLPHLCKVKPTLTGMIASQVPSVLYVEQDFYLTTVHVSYIKLEFFWAEELTLTALKLSTFVTQELYKLF